MSSKPEKEAIAVETPEWFHTLSRTSEKLDIAQFYEHQEKINKAVADQGIPIPLMEQLMTEFVLNSSHLVELCLKNCNLSDVGLDLLACALNKNTTLRHLDLRYNNLTAKAVETFTQNIHDNYSLTSCVLEEEAKDLHSKNVKRHEAFNIDTVESLVACNDDEVNAFDDARRFLNNVILTPNKDNLPCMKGTGPILNLSFRVNMNFATLQSMVLHCSQNITVLILAGMRLHELPGELDELKFLEELVVADNCLEYLPEELGALIDLQILDFSKNRIREFPKCIVLMESLTRIIAEDNLIERLPVSLTELKRLEKLFVLGNNIDSPSVPAKVWTAEKGDKVTAGSAVLNYLREIYGSGSRIVNKCKLMFVGDGGVGKSSLVKSFQIWTTDAKKTKKMQKKKIDVLPSQEKNIATDGIEVQSIWVETFGKKMKYSKGDKKKLEFTLWDFAGQEVYYSTHQFFLSDQSIYIVVCNMEKKDDASLARVEYWLQSLAARAPKAPVIIACSHYGDTKELGPIYFKDFKLLLERKFKERFKTLIEIYPVSNDTLKGIEEVLKGLVKIALSNRYKKKLGIEEERPISWLKLEEQARALRTTVIVPVIPWKKWVEVATTDCAIPKDGVATATEFLSSLGSILWFNTTESGLSDTVILDSQWLTEVFSSVVSAKHDPRYGVAGTIKSGILLHRDLHQIWRAPIYPPGIHPFLLAVLEKFEVLHRLEGNAVSNTTVSEVLLTEGNDRLEHKEVLTTSELVENNGRSLIPCLLPEVKPPSEELAIAWPEKGGNAATQIGRSYRFEFLPNGFFSRLMVRLLHSAWNAVVFWKFGIILSKSGSLLRLEEDAVTHNLFFWVRGPKGANHMGRLVESIDTLISDWLSVEVKIFVSCLGCQERGDPTPHSFPMETLQKAVSRGDADVRCPKCPNSIRLDLLVPDLTMTDVLTSDKKIDYKSITMGKEIGRGGFAVVYKGQIGSREVAVKQLIFDERTQGDSDTAFTEYFTEFRREVWLMSSMSHPNIVELVGVCHQPLCMVLEFCGAGNLYDWLHTVKAPKNKKELAQREQFAIDVSKGMEFLHSMTPPIIHRDLKSPNVLLANVKGNITCKIADFGLSRGLVWNSELEGKVVDNPIWLAPEILRQQKYSEKVDVYAFGIIMWELMTGDNLFGDTSFMSAIEDKIKRGERPQIPSHAEPYYGTLLAQCWSDAPSLRPSFEQCSRRLIKKLMDDEIPAAARVEVDEYLEMGKKGQGVDVGPAPEPEPPVQETGFTTTEDSEKKPTSSDSPSKLTLASRKSKSENPGQPSSESASSPKSSKDGKKPASTRVSIFGNGSGSISSPHLSSATSVTPNKTNGSDKGTSGRESVSSDHLSRVRQENRGASSVGQSDAASDQVGLPRKAFSTTPKSSWGARPSIAAADTASRPQRATVGTRGRGNTEDGQDTKSDETRKSLPDE